MTEFIFHSNPRPLDSLNPSLLYPLYLEHCTRTPRTLFRIHADSPRRAAAGGRAGAQNPWTLLFCPIDPSDPVCQRLTPPLFSQKISLSSFCILSGIRRAAQTALIGYTGSFLMRYSFSSIDTIAPSQSSASRSGNTRIRMRVIMSGLI